METSTCRDVALPMDNFRHPLMRQKSGLYLEKLEKELKLDQQLGLKEQINIDAHEVLKRDIEELTRSNNYYEVSKNDLHKLFQFRRLKAKCASFNIAEFFEKTFALLAFVTLLISSIVVNVKFLFGHNHQVLSLLSVAAAVAFGIACIIVLKMYADGNIKYKFLDIDLMMEDIQRTSMKIPYGAKLKIVEAKDSKIFEGFVIAYPKLKMTEVDFKIEKRMQLDPAILGVTQDKRMYMVCYWDIKLDVEKVVNQIDKMKKIRGLKVEG
jgi:hypothetical protein